MAEDRRLEMALTCSLTAFVFGFSTWGIQKRLGLCSIRAFYHTERAMLTNVVFIMLLFQSPFCCDLVDVAVDDFPLDAGNDFVPCTFRGWLLLVWVVGYAAGDVSGNDLVPCTFCRCWAAA